MSDDLVKRLRARPLYEGHGEASDLPDGAADLIEQQAARIAALEAERDRLREALKPFAKMGGTFVGDYPNAIKLDRTVAPVNGPAVSATIRVKHFQNATRVWEAGQ